LLRTGLTGGLGAGKSTVGQMLAARGAVVIDTDQVAREVTAPGSPGERAVLDHFGPSVASPEGYLDRRALADLVFRSRPELLALEAITHPLIRESVEAKLEAVAQAGRPVAVVQIPLLDRVRRRQYRLDVVVLVEAPEGVAIRRAADRGLSESDAQARIAAQPSEQERRAASDVVLPNSGTLQELEARVDDLWVWLLEQSRATGREASDDHVCS
jgi:dephospho-CoA kinase